MLLQGLGARKSCISLACHVIHTAATVLVQDTATDMKWNILTCLPTLLKQPVLTTWSRAQLFSNMRGMSKIK